MNAGGGRSGDEGGGGTGGSGNVGAESGGGGTGAAAEGSEGRAEGGDEQPNAFTRGMRRLVTGAEDKSIREHVKVK